MRSTSSSLPFALLVTACSGFLDAYTFIAKGGVFANAQTGNVIFVALDLGRAHWVQALARLCPIVAFVIGIGIATHIKSGKLDGRVAYPVRWTVGVQALILTVIGFLPGSWPHWSATIPIAFLAALQMELFRTIGDLNYMAIATTGNLMRLVEAGYGVTVDRKPDARRPFGTYVAIVSCFVGGAVTGAVVTRQLGGHAAWVPAVLLAFSLVLFVVDEREAPTP